MSIDSFFFYDYETFGIHPQMDRISQFAGIRTDANFNIIDEPINLFCKQYEDYLPHPESILITGITPEYCNQHGVEETQFAKRIHREFSQPNTCILGYNNIRFDDEMTRYLFYRNFYDPYAYSWQSGNSRWDLIDVVRATYALRPKGINWPMNEEGLPSFKLEKLTKANHLLHDRAHDALSDVYGTIEIAKLLRQQQPRLFDFYFKHRRRAEILTLINFQQYTPLVHISGMFGSKRNNLSIIMPIYISSQNKNLVVAVDLMGDISSLLECDSEHIRQYLYTKTEDLPNDMARIPFKNIHLNRAPILAPLSSLKGVKLIETNIEKTLKTHKILLENLTLIQKKARAIFEDPPRDFKEPQEVEAQLYDGFFNRQDQSQIELIHKLSPEQLAVHPFNFEDTRLSPLLFRYRAKNFPASMNDAERSIWKHHANSRLQRIKENYIPIYQRLLSEHQHNADTLPLLQSIKHYYE